MARYIDDYRTVWFHGEVEFLKWLQATYPKDFEKYRKERFNKVIKEESPDIGNPEVMSFTAIEQHFRDNEKLKTSGLYSVYSIYDIAEDFYDNYCSKNVTAIITECNNQFILILIGE